MYEKVYGFKGLEKKYGIKVRDDSYYHPLTGRYVRQYRMYSADWCPWAKGLSREGVKKECERWAKALIEIKNSVQREGW